MALPTQSDCGVSSGSIRLPLTLLDTLVPGSSHLASLLLGSGLDVSLFVSWGAILATVWAALHFGLIPAYQIVLKALTSSVIVEEYDPIYDHVLNWASAQKYLQNIRSLRAHTAGQYYDGLEDYEEDDPLQMQFREGMPEDTIFNFNNWSARAPPTFRPHSSSGWFFHSYRLFKLYRNRDRVASEYTGAVYERERLEISVIWLSPQPIKTMIQEAREFHLIRRTSTTTIKRPTPKSQRSGRGQAWTTIANRPSRSMATVVLDNEQKVAILKDFNDFLHPRTARWYSNRGIPYRRGYLFHGPPGTGKTSLSFALAGVFGLDIYCLALSEASLTEEDLILLFNSLPKRCILLLEDIDTAGLGRAPGSNDVGKRQTTDQLPSGGNNQDKKTTAENKDDKDDTSGFRGKATDQAGSVSKEPTFKNTLTFAGLLNAIDGVASQEGRVLIMTTNHVQRLDEALTRPGRIDLTIKFDLATKQQIKDLFLRMYCADSIEMRRQPTKISHILPNQAETDRPGANTSTNWGIEGNQIADLENHKDTPKPRLLSRVTSNSSAVFDLAERFADSLPDRTLSPAEIQGFLLVRKKYPAQAVADVIQWRDEQLQNRVESKVNKDAMTAQAVACDESRTESSDGVKTAGLSSCKKNEIPKQQQQQKMMGVQNGFSGEITREEEDGNDAKEPTPSSTVEPQAGTLPRSGPAENGNGNGNNKDNENACENDGEGITEDGDIDDRGDDQNGDSDTLCTRRRRLWVPHPRSDTRRHGSAAVNGYTHGDSDGDIDLDLDLDCDEDDVVF
ncbi:hypothetical protein AYO20_09616 [Fonsecaea nubica]|uniref:AAA+ ATPase domain-containing protein n=1 Tax=Fonsecaea nubica TaxID=856822 RepID=A0A178CF71_9EURO|nr:hypothetical protein AYO20_09616 [Fonsecaea nubica]OAL27994.1 hypothetical protein AYO20_09616 [Fonsecaea nubica]